MWSILAQATRHAGRGPEGGPIYLETDPTRLIVEPFNAASAMLFIALVAFWLVRLRGQYRRHAFLTACLPLVLVGGVGGTVYHAFRAHRAWLFMDWMPIAVLCLAVSIYLWSRLLRRWGYALLIIPAVVGLQYLNFRVLGRWRIGGAIAATYALMGVLIGLPAVLVLIRTRWRHGRFPLLAAVCFVLALTARTTDARWPGLFPMGTHFLWHVFGAAAGHLVAEYLYRLPAGRLIGPAATAAGPPAKRG